MDSEENLLKRTYASSKCERKLGENIKKELFKQMDINNK
jgi:hypothetical protein